MRIPRRASLALAVLLAAGVALTACTPADPGTHSTRSASPSPTPIFASDAEALAAATATFKHFEEVSDAIGRSGWADVSPLKPLISEAGYLHESQTAADYRSKDARAVGETLINNTTLESHTEADGRATVRIYVCEDLRHSDIRDGSGKSLVDPSRADFVQFESELSGASADSLIIESLNYWTGGSVCKR